MYEVEMKARADHGRVRDRIAAIGGTSDGTVIQADTFYDHPARSFAETDEALRLRYEESTDGETGRTTLTYKGPRMDDASKTRRELETNVQDGSSTDALLQALNFNPVGEVRKRRNQYRVDNFTIALDRVAGLGDFVEVERKGKETEIDSLQADVAGLLRRLGLDPADQIRASYLELLTDNYPDQ
ncbi:MAG: class IV adenylate cyclase [Halobacteriaceae archaeon]